MAESRRVIRDKRPKKAPVAKSRRLTDQMLAKIVEQAVEKAVTSAIVYKRGTIESIDDSAHTVVATIKGTKCYGIPYASHVEPTEGDIGWFFQQGSALLLLGTFDGIFPG